MSLQLDTLADDLLDELRPGLSAPVLAQVAGLAQALAGAGRIVCHGVGREGLMMRALAMRLYHLGLDAHVAGDMTAPPAGPGDVVFVSAGPGDFSTVAALCGVARGAGARVLCITAEPGGAVPRGADLTVHLPAQTMASDLGASDSGASDPGDAPPSILPMGSLYEALMFLFFEILVLDLRDRLGIAPDAMRARHTNLE